MATTKITIAYDGEDHGYVGIYINGYLQMDCEGYEATPEKVIDLLMRKGILKMVKVNVVDIHFEDSIEFPDTMGL